MARQRTKGKTTKNAAGKKITKTAGAKRGTGATKKTRKSAPRTSPPKPAIPRTVESTGALDLLRAWSPSRYSTR